MDSGNDHPGRNVGHGVRAITAGSGRGGHQVGVLIDLSGPTSDWGKNQVKGQLDAMRWVNENGGINGKELQLVVIDDGYDPAKGVAGYNRLVDSEKVLGIYIQSTGTTITLAKKIVADGVATIAASFTAKFEDPAKTPFSFYVSPSYGTMGRIALKWIRDNWKDPGRNPKICYISRTTRTAATSSMSVRITPRRSVWTSPPTRWSTGRRRMPRSSSPT